MDGAVARGETQEGDASTVCLLSCPDGWNERKRSEWP
jgi:hypothetical protein